MNQLKFGISIRSKKYFAHMVHGNYWRHWIIFKSEWIKTDSNINLKNTCGVRKHGESIYNKYGLCRI